MKDKMKQICIKDTFHVLKLQVNLFSVSKLLLNGLKMQCNLNECIVKCPFGEVDAIAICSKNKSQNGAFELWHCWLGHLDVYSCISKYGE